MLGSAFVADLNPYRAPTAASDLDPTRPDVPEKCPQCGARSASKVSFTWWGGALGPKLFSVVKCHQCSTQYNGKTGGKLTRVIIIYQVVAFVAFGALFFVLKDFWLDLLRR